MPAHLPPDADGGADSFSSEAAGGAAGGVSGDVSRLAAKSDAACAALAVAAAQVAAATAAAAAAPPLAPSPAGRRVRSANGARLQQPLHAAAVTLFSARLVADARFDAPPHPRAVRSLHGDALPPIDKLQSELLVQAFLEAGSKLPPANEQRSLAIWLGLAPSTVHCWFERMCAAQALLPRSAVAPVPVPAVPPSPPPPPPQQQATAPAPLPLPHLAWQCRCGATPFASRGTCHVCDVQRSAADREITVALRASNWSCAACGKPNFAKWPHRLPLRRAA
jgi:hypothetical protein